MSARKLYKPYLQICSFSVVQFPLLKLLLFYSLLEKLKTTAIRNMHAKDNSTQSSLNMPFFFFLPYCSGVFEEILYFSCFISLLPEFNIKVRYQVFLLYC